MTSSISSLLKIWKICHWLFSSKTLVGGKIWVLCSRLARKMSREGKQRTSEILILTLLQNVYIKKTGELCLLYRVIYSKHLGGRLRTLKKTEKNLASISFFSTLFLCPQRPRFRCLYNSKKTRPMCLISYINTYILCVCICIQSLCLINTACRILENANFNSQTPATLDIFARS